MAEHKLFDGDVPHVSTAAFHAHRERVPHLEQPAHQGRLNTAHAFVIEALQAHAARKPGTDDVTLSDLGCGDGGLLQTLRGVVGLTAWGYDFQPSNQAGWRERGVTAYQRDVFGPPDPTLSAPVLGDISVTTEVLEHVADPHGAVRWVGEHSRYLVASSPWNETPESHDECHAWAWDQDGYRALVEQGGFTVLRHETVGQFQVVLAEQKEATPCTSS
ncbi:methyltransferase domain-containing protein [Streptomyces sp. NPDC051642]|uniref:methyltransferase domain-containing protein n=1 Tax=Streptomyces sp. NPDC051642 TaxID=3154646 RepID=UPI00342C4CAF